MSWQDQSQKECEAGMDAAIEATKKRGAGLVAKGRMAMGKQNMEHDAGWRSGIPPHSKPGTVSDYYLAVGIDSDRPKVLIYQHAEGAWTAGGGDTQRVRLWAHIPPLPNAQISGCTPSAESDCSVCSGGGWVYGPSGAHPITESQETPEVLGCPKCGGTGKGKAANTEGEGI